jgi:glyoxylase-like metal-dependent hydrolase (beta-lactamase superfamily II)
VVLSENPLGDFLDSLALVRSMPDALLLPAHGPVAPSAHTRVDELLEHHGSRLALTERAVKAGAVTAYEAARLMTWTRRERDFRDLDWFNQMLAVNETQSHLVLLAEQGRLRRDFVEGVWCFGTA